jgi:hypothetical protein
VQQVLINMKKPRRKLTAAERAEKRRRRQEFMTIFVDGKQRRVRRPTTIDGRSEDEFILRNADPIPGVAGTWNTLFIH